MNLPPGVLVLRGDMNSVMYSGLDRDSKAVHSRGGKATPRIHRCDGIGRSL